MDPRPSSPHWRRCWLTSSTSAPGEFVVDLGTGTALALMPAARAGAAGIVGLDRSFGLLDVALRRVDEVAVVNVTLVRALTPFARVPLWSFRPRSGPVGHPFKETR